MNFKKIYLFLISAMILTAMSTACGIIGGGKTYKIGLLSPQTGPIAVYAPGFEDSANVAIAELNENEDGHVFELIVADSGCDGTQAATSAQTIIDAGAIGIVGAACSGATLGAIAVASEAGVPMVSYASTSPAVTTASDSGYLFRVVPSDAQQAIALTDVVAAGGSSNPAVLYMTNDYGAGLAESFAKNYFPDADADGEHVDEACVSIGYNVETQTDFQSHIDQIAAGACDSLVMISYATDGAMILETMAANEVYGAPTAVCSSSCPYPVMGADGMPTADDMTDAQVEAMVDEWIAATA